MSEESTETTNEKPSRRAAPKPKGAGPSGSKRRRDTANASAEKSDKPDTSGGVKIKLRGTADENGLLSVEELRQELQEVARDLAKYPGGTRFKWTTLYMTPIDQDGNRVAMPGPKTQTITPYKSAADEHKL